ncbi:methyltransferase [Pseudochrobactrum sp. HB0163]|uniref:methyltransferase n=1 Tax=Pseudochrobactrum sp. HB0163 TaxID=3450708 RepID=UPI003F6DE8E1
MPATPPFDEDALEQAYNEALRLEKSGDFDAAASAYKKVLEIDPDDHGGVAVRLASMGRGAVPVHGAPVAYVVTLFDQHAEMFDTILVDQLGYDVPLQLADQLEEIDPDAHYARMLDLGCGTGLGADALFEMTEHRTGVDLAENMIAIADEKGDYHLLYVAEAVNFLDKTDAPAWDIIIATDVLPYMGDLEPFFSKIPLNLNRNGIFAFSSETLNDEDFAGCDFTVGPHQRFAHQRSYVENLLASHGMTMLRVTDITVRNEQGKPVAGHLYIARKA